MQRQDKLNSVFPFLIHVPLYRGYHLMVAFYFPFFFGLQLMLKSLVGSDSRRQHCRVFHLHMHNQLLTFCTSKFTCCFKFSKKSRMRFRICIIVSQYHNDDITTLNTWETLYFVRGEMQEYLLILDKKTNKNWSTFKSPHRHRQNMQVLLSKLQ